MDQKHPFCKRLCFQMSTGCTTLACSDIKQEAHHSISRVMISAGWSTTSETCAYACKCQTPCILIQQHVPKLICDDKSTGLHRSCKTELQEYKKQPTWASDGLLS